jgi:hypothetical protein
VKEVKEVKNGSSSVSSSLYVRRGSARAQTATHGQPNQTEHHMTDLADLRLTPTQRAEVDQHEPAYIQAWLTELQTANAKTPAAWFLAGIRTGRLPGEHPDAEQARQTRLAETWIRNAGGYEPDEQSLLEGLFGEHGRLHPWADNQQLRNRMLELYRQERPRFQQAENRLTEHGNLYRQTQQRTQAAKLELDPEP